MGCPGRGRSALDTRVTPRYQKMSGTLQRKTAQGQEDEQRNHRGEHRVDDGPAGALPAVRVGG